MPVYDGRGTFRILFLAAGLILALGPAACSRPVLLKGTPKGLEGWKRQCGLLWILTLKADGQTRIRISGKGGEILDYGKGFPVEGHCLASSFCATDVPVVARFHCYLDAASDAPVSGQLEAWFGGRQLSSWTFEDVHHFEALAVLPPVGTVAD